MKNIYRIVLIFSILISEISSSRVLWITYPHDQTNIYVQIQQSNQFYPPITGHEHYWNIGNYEAITMSSNNQVKQHSLDQHYAVKNLGTWHNTHPYEADPDMGYLNYLWIKVKPIPDQPLYVPCHVWPVYKDYGYFTRCPGLEEQAMNTQISILSKLNLKYIKLDTTAPPFIPKKT